MERLAGLVWEDHDLEFPTPAGQPMDGTNVLRYHYYPLLQRAGLPRIQLDLARRAERAGA